MSNESYYILFACHYLIGVDQYQLADSIELHIDSQSIKEEDLIEKYRDLSEAILLEKTVSFSIFNSTPDKFLHTENSGKTLRVVDQRVF